MSTALREPGTTPPLASVPPLAAIVRVFVSSTWRDLQPEREKVQAVLNTFRETKFTGMEYFGSRPKGARDTSLDEVGVAQLYIGIFGGRWGSGITEAEYRRACALDLPCLLYIKRSPDAVDEGEESRARQSSLLAELRANVNQIAKEFDGPDDLAAIVAVDLHYWLFEQYLIPLLSDAAARDVSAASLNPVLAGVRDRLSLGTPLLNDLSGHGYAFGLTAAAEDGEARQFSALANRVRQAWISGVLDQSVIARR